MDDIALEIRKEREVYAQQFGYDIQAIHRNLKTQEEASDRRIVSLPRRQLKVVTANGIERQPPGNDS